MVKKKKDPIEKECAKCKKIKLINEFKKCYDKRNGDDYYYYRSICILCGKLYHEEWKKRNPQKVKELNNRYRKKNKEKIKQRLNNYYHNNLEKIKAQNKEYKEKNKDKLAIKRKEYISKPEIKEKNREYHKKYREENKEKLQQQARQKYLANKDSKLAENKKYRKKNKDKISQQKKEYNAKNKNILRKKKNIYQKKRYHNDVCFRLRQRISCSIRIYLKKNGGSKESRSILDYLPYTVNELKNHLESLWEPWMSWDNYGTYRANEWDDNDLKTWRWQIDHIIPHSNLPYKSMKDDNFKKCWALDNLRPLSAKVNIFEGVNKNRH